MAPARTATKTDGPQEIREYTYPQGDPEGTLEVVSRHGRFKALTPPPGPHAVQEFEHTDGNGALPVEDRPNTIGIRMNGIIQAHQGATMWFQRARGSTGAYQVESVLLDGQPGPRLPVSRAQR